MYALGLVLMLGSDAQKYFVLRERPGLISHGYFAYTRNPNYLGEIIIYASFAMNAQSTGYWIYLVSFWLITFSLRIL
jgi:steroid 5-alpha reductase family enzyme